jgi:predicted acyltransferase
MTTLASQTPPDAADSSADSSPRLMSLDALRGFDMFWIIGGAAFFQSFAKAGDNAFTRFLQVQLRHVTWEGFVFYDLIFPLFLFILGASLVLSLDKALATGGRAAVLARVLRRSVLLFALGVFRSGGLTEPWPSVELGGVLHRIAACYFFAALVYCFVRSAAGLIVVAAASLVGYAALLAFVPFPDLKLERATVEQLAKQIGSDSPAAIAAAVPQQVVGVYEEGRNLTNYLDFRFLPGRKAQIYYINEGLLSTLPSLALPLLGAVAGLLLRNPQIAPSRKVMFLAAAGVFCIALGLAWSPYLPIIKRIWSSSFVLVAAGLSSLVTALFYYVIDVREHRRWCQPFVWIGCNAIVLYLAVNVVNFRSVAERLVGGDVKQFLNAHLSSGYGDIATAAVALLLVFALARFLYARRIFLRV